MKAVSIAGKRLLSVIETETPKADGHNVIVKVSKAGICGSDLHVWEEGENMKGLIMGHEFSGTVTDLGALKGTIKIDDRVTALPLNPCGKCESCKSGNINICPTVWNGALGLGAPGAFAEFAPIRPDMVRKVPDTITDIEAAMIEPAAVALRAVRLAEVKVGDKVLITGAGIIGLLSAAWARLSGASYIAITEINALRGENAFKMGDVDNVFDANDPELVNKLTEASKGSFNVAIDCAAFASAVNTALQTVAPGGKLVLVGVSFDPVQTATALIVTHGLNIIGSIAYTSAEFERCIELLAQKKINLEPCASSIIGFGGAQDAFERLTTATNSEVKVILTP